MKRIFLCVLAGALALTSVAEEKPNEFTITKEVKHTPVISQGRTGTCWSFSTTSFLESEIMRKGFPETDLSEMFFVYHTYENKAERYLMYHGKNNFSQGGQAHDVIDVLNEYGVSSFKSFPGNKVEDRYNHRELAKTLDEKVKELNKKKRGEFDAADLKPVTKVLKKEIGKLPKVVENNGEEFSPIALREKFEFSANDYIELSSYSHHPFYKPFVLEVPDNWSHDLYYNLPVDELMEVMYYALENGFSICWDGDTSEKTFTHKKGLAELPKRFRGKVDQDLRQKTFLDRSTTDDHLMHLVGLSKDAEGRKCFYTKNSWGSESNNYGGYLHMTEDYVRLKTVAILLHKDAIPATIKKKLNL